MFKKKIPYIYNAIVKTGLASIDDLPPPHEIDSNVLVPPFAAKLDTMNDEELKETLVTFAPIFIHNCVVSDDFPFDSELRHLLKTHEKKIKKIKHNPWVDLMFSYGQKNSCPDPASLDVTMGTEDRFVLAMSREQWSKRAGEFVMDFVGWEIKNKSSVNAWYTGRCDLFQKSA